jgi:3-phenylpropionate/trans-cinnamate dioxygenase ferredoxin subunit
MPMQVASLQEVPVGKRKAVAVQGRGLILLNHDGRILAFDERCSHRGCSLLKGALAGNSIECPCHSACFNIISGKVIKGPATEPIGVYRVSIENEMIAVDI